MNRILLEHTEVDSAGCATLVGRPLEHVRKVLQVKEGNTLRVGLINGPVGTAHVERVYAEGVDIRCVWERELKRSGIDLILGLPRPKVMRRLWPHIAMLGVDRLFLIRAEKVERYYFDSHVLDPEVYEPLLLTGVEQAGCTQLPKVSIEKQTIIKISGVDKELVSKIAADIKTLKPVEPYKAKGIKEQGQYVLRKEGKKK